MLRYYCMLFNPFGLTDLIEISFDGSNAAFPVPVGLSEVN